MIVVFSSLRSIPFCRNRFGILWMRYTVVGTASCGRLFRQLLFHGKEEFAGKAFRIKRDSLPLHLIKPNRGREGTKSGKRYKREIGEGKKERLRSL